MIKRKKGYRSEILFNEADLMILKILKDKSKDISIMQLKKMMNISNISHRTHMNRLVGLGFVIKKKVPGHNLYNLDISSEGEKALNLFTSALNHKKQIGKKK
jgi:predicted transcriptional regulator